jgi:hypothetical protein
MVYGPARTFQTDKSAKGGAAWLMTLREASWEVVDRSNMFDLRISLRRPQTPG